MVKYSYRSYRDSSRTNVAKLWYLYDTNNMANSCKVYVEGPGTSRPSEKLMKGTPYNDEEGKVSSPNSVADVLPVIFMRTVSPIWWLPLSNTTILFCSVLPHN